MHADAPHVADPLLSLRDVTVALQLLQTVSGHLSSAAVALQEARAGKPDPEA